MSDENIFDGKSDLLLSDFVASLPRWMAAIEAELSDMPDLMQVGTMSRRDIAENHIALIWRDELHDEEHLLIDVKSMDDGSLTWRARALTPIGRIFWKYVDDRYLRPKAEAFRAVALHDVNKQLARVLSSTSQRMGDIFARKGMPEYDFPVPDIRDFFDDLLIDWQGDLFLRINPETWDVRVTISSRRGRRLWRVFVDMDYFSGGPYKKRVDADGEKQADGGGNEQPGEIQGKTPKDRKYFREYKKTMVRAFRNFRKSNEISVMEFLGFDYAKILKECFLDEEERDQARANIVRQIEQKEHFGKLNETDLANYSCQAVENTFRNWLDDDGLK